MNDELSAVSRRAFLQRIGLAAGAGVFLTGLTPGPERPASCTDVSGLTEEQIQTRKTLQYVDKTPQPDKPCMKCRFFTRPAEGKPCGGCTVVPGPIHPKGYCTSWTAA